jgi:crotonobetainyl-CoA:carnitine CoA-transferase CaiB-like acyl-CoA transferase
VIKHQRTWGGNAFYQIYETADGRFVCLGGVEYKFADNLMTALGRPDLAPLCKEPPGPVQDPVKEFLRQQFKTRTQAQWVEWFDGRDVCFAPILDLKEAFDDPNVRQREMLLFDDDGTEHIGVPIKFKDEPAAPRFPVPGFGEHSGAIAKRLGYDDDEVEALFADRVIG